VAEGAAFSAQPDRHAMLGASSNEACRSRSSAVASRLSHIARFPAFSAKSRYHAASVRSCSARGLTTAPSDDSNCQPGIPFSIPAQVFRRHRQSREIVRLGVQLIRDQTEPRGDIGRVIGDPPHLYRGHAQERDGELLRPG
jgi:hypothetical protein